MFHNTAAGLWELGNSRELKKNGWNTTDGISERVQTIFLFRFSFRCDWKTSFAGKIQI